MWHNCSGRWEMVLQLISGMKIGSKAFNSLQLPELMSTTHQHMSTNSNWEMKSGGTLLQSRKFLMSLQPLPFSVLQYTMEKVVVTLVFGSLHTYKKSILNWLILLFMEATLPLRPPHKESTSIGNFERKESFVTKGEIFYMAPCYECSTS